MGVRFLRFAVKTSAVWISAVLALVFFPACNADSGSSSDGDGAPSSESVALGQPARDGQFEFVVGQPQTTKTVGEEPLANTAQGVYLVFPIKVTNIGDEARYFDANFQELVDSEGREFSASGMASGGDAFLNEINPGNSVESTIAFDVPEGLVPAKLILHDDMMSGGVEVTVSG